MSEALLPMLGAGLLSGAGSYFGGQAAANASTAAADQANNRYNQALGYAQPYIQGGTNALHQYNNAIGVNGSGAQSDYFNNFQNDPGFQSSVNYGLDQIAARNAAQGMGNSGNTQAALQDWSQHSLSGEYQTRLDNLFRESQTGANSANAALGASTGASNVVSNALTSSGNALGNSYSALGKTGNTTLTNMNDYYYGKNS
jgi:hypothetical protein